METQLALLSKELSDLSAAIGPSVVAVEGQQRSYSSGVHWRKNLVVTAEHTVRRDEEFRVILSNQKEMPAKVIGRDSGTDIALLQVEQLDVPVAKTRSSQDIRVGEIMLVLGRSPNSGINASAGIISAVSGSWRTWRGGQLDSYLRLDATVFSGSSGGAVVDHEGRIVGIATNALSRVAGLAIPASTIEKVIDALLKHGAVPRGYIGVGLQQVALPESFKKSFSLDAGQGLMVFSVEPSGAAEKGGILVGDILLEVDGKSTANVEDLQNALVQETIGKRLVVQLIRGGEMKRLTIEVGERMRG